MKNCLLLFLLSVVSLLNAQGTHHDVAVIVNDSSPESVQIGQYFAAARGIPTSRILHVSAPDTRDIDSVQFVQIRNQIANAILSRNLLDTLNCLVTTMGMPERITLGNGCQVWVPGYNPTLGDGTCWSMEDRLSLILSPEAPDSEPWTYEQNNYLRDTVPFSRPAHNYFMVTRLDGRTVSDVIALIDRTPLNGTFDPSISKVVFDAYADQNYPFGIYVLNTYGPSWANFCVNAGINYMMDTSNSVLLQGIRNVQVFVTELAGRIPDPSHHYLSGSVVSFLHSTATDNLISERYTQAKEMIAQGACGTLARTNLYYFGPSFDEIAFVQFYLAQSGGFKHTFAEAIYASKRLIGGNDVFIGDPKMFIQAIPTAVEDPFMEHIAFNVYPNPAATTFTISASSGKGGITHCQIFNSLGQLAFEAEVKTPHEGINLAIDVKDWSTGVYSIYLRQGKSIACKKLVVMGQ